MSKKRKIKELIISLPLFLTLVIGMFGILIISHETYHYFMIDGTATGVCFGKCDLGNTYENTTKDTWATGSVSWLFTKEQYKNFDLMKEEQNAWIFSFIFTGLFMVLLVYLEFIK